MNIFIVGANGQIGRHLMEKIAEGEHTGIAGVRDVESQSLLEDSSVSYVSFDLTWSVDKIAEQFKQAAADVVVFAAGSQGKSLLQVDLDGAIKTMLAAEKAGISRYLMVSAAYADQREKWPESMTDYYISKHYADEWLMHQTKLDYVIVQPVTLTNDPSSKKITAAHPGEETNKKVSRESIALVLADLVDRPSISQTTLLISDGETEISEALDSWKN